MSSLDLTLTLVPTTKNHARLVARKDGVELGYMTIIYVDDEGLIVEHTLVHEENRVRGVARAMFDHVVGWARRDRLYVVPLCPFVLSRFEKQPDTSDVRATCTLRQG